MEGEVSTSPRSHPARGAGRWRSPLGENPQAGENRRAKDSSLPRLVSPMHGAKIGCNDIRPTYCSELARLCRTQTLWHGAALREAEPRS